jgi:hypothetical protein
LRIPAAEIEQIVTERFRKLCGEPAELSNPSRHISRPPRTSRSGGTGGRDRRD